MGTVRTQSSDLNGPVIPRWGTLRDYPSRFAHGAEKSQAATQYALLSALFGLTRSIAGPLSGVLTE